MNIAFITEMAGHPWGGSEELWSRTAVRCSKNNHKVLACVYDWDPEPIQINNLIAEDIQVIKLKPTLNAPKRFYKRLFNHFAGTSPRHAQENTLKKIQSFKPDIICISQGGTFNISANKYLYNFLMGLTTPFVIICHHNSEYGGGFSDQQARYEKSLFNKARSVLFVAERNLETAERQLGCKIQNAMVIGNPVNLKNKGIKSNHNNTDQLKMACVARLETAFKGQDILLQALNEDLWKDRKFHLKLYGAGPDMEYLNRLIKYYDLQDNVTIVGHTMDIDSIWQENDLLILPSISEGTPLSLVEAMLSGRPALATDVGGISKYIINGVTGFLAPTASVKCLSAAMEDVWNNREKLKKMGEEAYIHALSITDHEPEMTLLGKLI